MPWEKQDQLLHSWLLSSILDSVLGHVVGHNTSQAVWSALAKLFSSHSRACIMQRQSQLQTTHKGAMSVEIYLLLVKNVSDTLSAAGSPMLEEDLILYVLSSLGPEYDSIAIHVIAR